MTAIDSIRISANDLLERPELLDLAVASIPENDPARQALRTYAGDLLSLPGAQFASWSRRAPGSVGVQFSDAGHTRLADAVLRDTVAGASLLLKTDTRPDVPMPKSDETDRPRKQPFWESVSNMRRAVTGMRGVFDYSANTEHGQRSLTFKTVGKDHNERLQPLVNEYLGTWRTTWWAPTNPKA